MSRIQTREIYPWVDKELIKDWLDTIKKENRLVGITYRTYKGRLKEWHGKDIEQIKYREE